MKKGSKNILPILFNTEMVRAILEDRKTVTRRVVTPQPPAGVTQLYHGAAPGRWRSPGKDVWVEIRAPYQPGDILWVRETWTKLWYADQNGYTHYEKPMYYYAADGAPDITLVDEDGFEEDEQRIRWHPSIHMPWEAARIFLRVTDVQVERLQKIDDAGVVAEGLEIGCYFDELWNSTIKPKDRSTYGWDANPWVWVINFERISEEEAELEQ